MGVFLDRNDKRSMHYPSAGFAGPDVAVPREGQQLTAPVAASMQTRPCLTSASRAQTMSPTAPKRPPLMAQSAPCIHGEKATCQEREPGCREDLAAGREL